MEEVSCFLKWDSDILSCMEATSYRPNPIHILQQRRDNPRGCLGCGLPGFSYPIQEWEPFLHGCRLFCHLCHLCPLRRQYTMHMRWRVSSHCWFATVPSHTCTQGPAVKRHKLQKVCGRDNRLSPAGLKQHQPTFMWQQSWYLSISLSLSLSLSIAISESQQSWFQSHPTIIPNDALGTLPTHVPQQKKCRLSLQLFQ